MTAWIVVGPNSPVKATIRSSSTILRASDSALPGSPPSSPNTTRTGRPPSPPPAFTLAAHARTATGIDATLAPMGPDPVPSDPSTTSAPVGVPGTGPGAADPPAPDDPPGRPAPPPLPLTFFEPPAAGPVRPLPEPAAAPDPAAGPVAPVSPSRAAPAEPELPVAPPGAGTSGPPAPLPSAPDEPVCPPGSPAAPAAGLALSPSDRTTSKAAERLDASSSAVDRCELQPAVIETSRPAATTARRPPPIRHRSRDTMTPPAPSIGRSPKQ
jgi:hypothetical protein